MTEESCEILLFQVGPRVFATDVRAVVRIGPVAADAADLVEGTALGQPFLRRRGIVVDADGGERTLVVDHVLGIRAVADEDRRPLPALLAECLRSTSVTGFVLVDEIPMLLVDVPFLVREQPIVARAAP